MFESIHRIHLIGIGGIGISALAKLLLHQGKQLTGSDVHLSSITDDLVRRGIQVWQGHDPSAVSDAIDLVIYSPAVQETDPEYVSARKLGIPLLSYAQALGELSKQYSTIVVTGTHGKSTTTSMLGLILEAAGYDPTVIVGSIVPSFAQGNLRVGGGRFLVVEGCEHQANMLQLHPEMIVLTSIEADHLDYYKTLANVREAFQTFVNRLSGKGLVVMNADDSVSQTLTVDGAVRYGTGSDTHYQFGGRRIENGRQHVTVRRRVPEEELGELSLTVPGAFNVSNALAATAAAMELGVPFETCVRALGAFPGIWRRFERLGQWNGCELISDYGHHPTAIRVTLEAARELFPGKKLILCFQPHQHSRTQSLFNEFVEALSFADAVVLPEIYRVEGRTEDESVSSRDLAAACHLADCHYAPDFETAERILKTLSHTYPDSVIIIQGAGTIDELARSLIGK